jgi:hypothetical protein
MERLADPTLIGVESAAALERENDLARQSLRLPVVVAAPAPV